jgi:cellulose 1,4-beta-cellobiosidase
VQPADVGHTVVVTVTASNSGGSASATSSATIVVADTVPPSAPSSLKASATDGTHVALTWTASTDNVGVAGYRVYRGGALVGTVTSPGFTDGGLTAGTTYSYSVVAYDAAGNASAAATAGATTPAPNDTSPPTAPSGLQANAHPGPVNLSWRASTDNVGVAGYRVWRDGTQIGTVDGATLQYADSNAASGKHTYTVTAFDAAGNQSPPSNAKTVNV